MSVDARRVPASAGSVLMGAKGTQRRFALRWWGLLLTLVVALGGCYQIIETLVPTPSLYKDGSRIHAFQSYSFIYSFADGNSAQWLATLDVVERDAVPFLQALHDGKHQMSLEVKPVLNEQGVQYEYYVIDAVFTMPDGQRVTLPGTPGTDPAVYEAAVSQVASGTGLDKAMVQSGHFALYGMVQAATGLNAENVVLRQHAFKLLVLREKAENGEQADWFDGNRDPKETIADVDTALQLIAHDQNRVAAERATITGMTAMAAGYRAQASLDEFTFWIKRSRASAQKWRQTHQRPTIEDFGVRVALPTPETVLSEVTERFGWVGSVVKIAKGVATADLGDALEGVAELTPEDSTARVVLEGLAAAVNGDIDGTLTAVAELAGYTQEYEALKASLNVVDKALSALK